MIERMIVQGDAALESKLQALRASKNLKPFWNTAKTLVGRGIRRHFRERQGPKGRWAPLSDVTPMLRGRGGNAPLQDETLLIKSVTVNPVIKESALELVYGTNVKYAPFQQEGFHINVTPRMRGFFLAKGVYEIPEGATLEVPPRPFLYIDREMEKELEKGLKFHFQAIVRLGGAGSAVALG